MTSSLSNLVNNLFEGIKLNEKTDTMIKNVKLKELNMNIPIVSLNTQSLKMI